VSLVTVIERARVAALLVALGWSLWSPCVCSAVPHERPAAHCGSQDSGDEGLGVGHTPCCCDRGATVQAPPATVARENSFGPLHALPVAPPAPSLARAREDVRPGQLSVVADSPPPRLIALRI
jgi:hypothetical protein